jgi:hypothetical protein
MSTNYAVGIVTVLYNSDDVLPDFFNSLARQKEISFKLYAIDNSATDSGSRICRTLSEMNGIEAEVVFNNENVGVAKGNNQGIELALRDRCEYVLLANNDIVFYDEFLLNGMYASMTRNQQLALIPKILYYGSNLIWCVGGRFSMLKATVSHIGDMEQDNNQYENYKVTDYAPTCFMMLDRSVFDKVGLMNERYFVYYDDVDFAWRMKKFGVKLYVLPNVNLWHKVSFSTGGGNSLFGIYYLNRNRILFARLHLFYMFPLTLFYIFLSAAKNFVKFNSVERRTLLKALRDGFSI